MEVEGGVEKVGRVALTVRGKLECVKELECGVGNE
jgi:hypothetical protein